ncbi:hypothetical protein ACFPC0_10770 [Streptomyces andamanensis]|uniref:Uncharacterized protein n=1 Tax=Streptomyces andamanensis TaxID=1565035 RepID=A0ABV8TCQ1_9ACTN
MTQPPGRTAHRDGDGCTGQHRTVDPEGADEIRYRVRRALTRADVGDWDETAVHAEWAAQHYGSPGEYRYDFTLSHYVREGLRTTARRATGTDYHPVPALDASVPLNDREAISLFERMAARRNLTGTSLERLRDLIVARLPLQSFLLHLHTEEPLRALRMWSHVQSTGRRHSQLLPLAFTAQLTIWATRATFGSETSTAWADLNSGSTPS